MTTTMYSQLIAPFDRHYKDPRGLTYLTGNQVIGRLNEVLGPGGWSFDVKEHGYSAEADEIWALGHLTADIDGVTVHREQFGSQKHNRRRSDNKILDYGFDSKGAATDAMKKCATLIGVGLYLSEREGGVLNMDAVENYQCVQCQTNIVTPNGEIINADQAQQLLSRFGVLLCREHRQPAHAAATGT